MEQEEARCPRRPIFDNPEFYYRLFQLFSAYLDGFLPEEGGINHQPALLVDYFSIMKQVKTVLDKQDMDRGHDEQGDEPSVSILRR